MIINECIYFDNFKCKLDNTQFSCTGCDIKLNRDEIVYKNALSKELRELIEKSQGKMLFVENDNEDYSEVVLQHMMNEILIFHPVLSDCIDIDATREGDALITIYEDAYSKIIL